MFVIIAIGLFVIAAGWIGLTWAADDTVVSCRRKADAVECRADEGDWHELDPDTPVEVDADRRGKTRIRHYVLYPRPDGTPVRFGKTESSAAHAAAQRLNDFASGSRAELRIELPFPKGSRWIAVGGGAGLVVVALILLVRGLRRSPFETVD